MTPNEKTSDFSDNLPLDAYSGAKYLCSHKKRKKKKIRSLSSLNYSVGEVLIWSSVKDLDVYFMRTKIDFEKII